MEDEENNGGYVELSFHQHGKLIKMNKKKRKKRALVDLICMVEDSIHGNYLLDEPYKKLSPNEGMEAINKLKKLTLWGVPLMPSKGHEETQVLLMKFLKASDFKVIDAFEMLRSTLKWRKKYNIDKILEDDTRNDEVDKVLYITSTDKEGRPLYFNVFGGLKDKDSYERIFGTEDNIDKFLRWRIELMEKCIEKLELKIGGVDSLIVITDLKNSSWTGMKELRNINKKVWITLHQHYPELIHKDIIINAPFWYYASHVLNSKVISQRVKKKFVFARPNKVTKTLLKFISPENLPIEYGGLRRENDDEFSSEDKVVYQIRVKPNSTKCIKIPIVKVGVTIIWDVTVVGWEVWYKEEFIPDDEGSYNILIQQKKGTESIRNSFYINEPGKIVITIDNGGLKKKNVLYRYKTKPIISIYLFNK